MGPIRPPFRHPSWTEKLRRSHRSSILQTNFVQGHFYKTLYILRPLLRLVSVLSLCPSAWSEGFCGAPVGGDWSLAEWFLLTAAVLVGSSQAVWSSGAHV